MFSTARRIGFARINPRPDGGAAHMRHLIRWAEIDVLMPADCGHIDTLCLACAPTWQSDWEIDLSPLENH